MSKQPIVECIPNISEGRDKGKIDEIVSEVKKINGVKLLHVDSGYDTNRTVITFAGSPDAVAEAAFNLTKKATELIDMTKQSGKHPRIGAVDVIPLVPVSDITMEDVVHLAHHLSERIGNELSVPVYCYEEAAYTNPRRNLANCRKGEYEDLKHKLILPEWHPDFGPVAFNEKSGATVVGARNFLVAFNINLKSSSAKIATEIAKLVRESGYVVEDEEGNLNRIPGQLKHVKAIGWYIEEYGFAQVSMNLPNLDETPLHVAFEEVKKKANAIGIDVTGSEIVGLVPLKGMLEAGKYYTQKQGFDTKAPDKELISIAITSMGLSHLTKFNAKEKIIEYVLED